jgi:hypothetical protein
MVAQDIDGDALTYSVDDVSKGLGVVIDALGRITGTTTIRVIWYHDVL